MSKMIRKASFVAMVTLGLFTIYFVVKTTDAGVLYTVGAIISLALMYTSAQVWAKHQEKESRAQKEEAMKQRELLDRLGRATAARVLKLAEARERTRQRGEA